MNRILSLSLSYGAVASGFAGGYAGLVHGDQLLAGSLCATALVLILLRIGADSTISTPTLDTATAVAPRPRSLGAVVVGLLLVSAAAGGGALGPDAQRVYEENSPVGEAEAIACGGACLAGVGIAVSFAAGYVANEYLAGDDPEGEVVVEAESTETHIQTSTHADTIAVDSHTLDTVMSNQVNDGSRTVAYAKAKAAAVRAMNNGSSKAEVKAAATNATEDYYSTMEVNLINSYNSQVNRLLYLKGVYDSDGGISGNALRGGDVGNTHSFSGTVNYTYTLENGSTMPAKFMTVNDGGEFAVGWTQHSVDNPDRTMDFVDRAGKWMWNYEANVTPHNSSEIVMNGDRSTQIFSDIDSANADVESNIDLWIDNYYDGYTAGEINDSEILDPATMAQEFATDYNTTGHYSYAAADLAIQGINGSMNHSMVIDLHNGSAGRTTNETLNGTLFTDWKPSATGGKWETGHTYDTANSSSLVYVATNDGLRVIEGEFSIPEMVNVQTGEAVTNTTTQEYHRQTVDSGPSAEDWQQLLDLQQELDDTQAAAAGGGSNQGLLIGIAAAAAIALLMGRRD